MSGAHVLSNFNSTRMAGGQSALGYQMGKAAVIGLSELERHIQTIGHRNSAPLIRDLGTLTSASSGPNAGTIVRPFNC